MVVGLYVLAGHLGPKSCWDVLKFRPASHFSVLFIILSLCFSTVKSCAKVNTLTNNLTEYSKLLTLVCEYKNICRYLNKYFYTARAGQKNQSQKNKGSVPYINVVYWCVSDEEDEDAAIGHRLPRSLGELYPPAIHFTCSHLLSHFLLRA